MDKQCAECKTQLPKDGQYVVCKTGCSGGYHFDCTTISQSTYRTRSKKDKDAWRCHSCRKSNVKTRDTNSDDNDSDDGETKADADDVNNRSMLREILRKMEDIKSEIKNNYQMLKNENEQLKKKMDVLIEQGKEKDIVIAQMSARINELE